MTCQRLEHAALAGAQLRCLAVLWALCGYAGLRWRGVALRRWSQLCGRRRYGRRLVQRGTEILANLRQLAAEIGDRGERRLDLRDLRVPDNRDFDALDHLLDLRRRRTAGQLLLKVGDAPALTRMYTADG
ncbi:MAG: hypothetical protein M3R61_00435 [Chloroflexota bacterium]|nr:hypothetical protein [Chloroflexota bacterium]